MLRLILAALLLPLLLLADNFRLYLTDGTWHQVSEYKLEADRIRYYSVERGDWEEIPASLVDLKKTETERHVVVEVAKKAAAADDAEEKFEREEARLLSLIPMEAGAYYLDGEKALTLKQAESKIVTSKKRAVLKAIAPLPIVPGKASIELDGEHSAFVVRDSRPAFWLRISTTERFGILRCRPKKDVRVVEKWNIMSATNEISSDRETLEIFRQQVGNDLYKLWPQEALAPGEYAVIQFAEGERGIQLWDFRVETPEESPAGKTTEKPAAK
jgi:hypothetical protein